MSSEADGPIWSRPAPGARRPRFTRDQIAATALEIADAEGFDAVSMRRLAAALGAGTMTLYHYVQSKEELLVLMQEAIMAELVVPEDELPGDWREALTGIAHRTRAAFRRHPWALESLRGVYSGGPNMLRHIEESLAAVAGTGLEPTARLELIALIDDYVFGFLLHEAELTGKDAAVDDEGDTALRDFFDSLLNSGDFPQLVKLRGDGDERAAWERMIAVLVDPGRFDRGLQRLLDGIELELERGRHGE
jgi:AcrR family transcriptional regulator